MQGVDISLCIRVLFTPMRMTHCVCSCGEDGCWSLKWFFLFWLTLEYWTVSFFSLSLYHAVKTSWHTRAVNPPKMSLSAEHLFQNSHTSGADSWGCCAFVQRWQNDWLWSQAQGRVSTKRHTEAHNSYQTMRASVLGLWCCLCSNYW